MTVLPHALDIASHLLPHFGHGSVRDCVYGLTLEGRTIT
jgi:hypothetical protein